MFLNSCCSAPGKVLLTGGYLVLERPNTGIVLSVNARFFSTIHDQRGTTLGNEKGVSIRVSSPQFGNISNYIFMWSPEPKLTPIDIGHKENKYTEKTILHTLSAIQAIISPENFLQIIQHGLLIEIVGDNDFYSMAYQLNSRKLPQTSTSLKSLPRFLAVGSTLDILKKTGLGSSAALVTSLTAALLAHFGVINLHTLNSNPRFSPPLSSPPLSQENSLLFVHNLAQFNHCAAQGKVGSGFDVSSATFGSQIYQRFSPHIINALLKQSEEGCPNPRDILHCMNSPWNTVQDKFILPPGLEIILGDVNAGSNTPIMVRKLLEWKQAKPEESSLVWNALANKNKEIEEQFKFLNSLLNDPQSTKNYHETRKLCSQLHYSLWSEKGGEIGARFSKLRDSFKEMRALFKKMGVLSDVPLEPNEQTELADITMEQAGVICSAVPGAGGFDAIYVLVLDSEVISKIEKMWEEKGGILPLILRNDLQGVCMDRAPTVILHHY